MKDLVLITGASSGIGYEMANQLAVKKLDLLLVARNGQKLNELKIELERQHGINVYVIQKDLADEKNARALYEDVKKLGLEVTMLVNNAGKGIYGLFSDTDLDDEVKMVQLNITSLVVLTKLFLQDMLVRKQGKIMNIASLLSFLPFPYLVFTQQLKVLCLLSLKHLPQNWKERVLRSLPYAPVLLILHLIPMRCGRQMPTKQTSLLVQKKWQRKESNCYSGERERRLLDSIIGLSLIFPASPLM